MAYNKNNQLKKNIDAITLALQIKAEGRTEISSEEYNTISSYFGFGGLKCILYPAEKESDIAFWISSEKINFNAIYKIEFGF